MDLYSRKVIGWALSRSLRSELCLEALQIAIETRDPGPYCVHHSDRGVQYACDAYIMKLQQNGIVISMTRKGNPYDNAFMESFMKTLKRTGLKMESWGTPLVTGCQPDVTPFTITFWARPISQLFTHLIMLLSNWILAILSRRTL